MDKYPFGGHSAIMGRKSRKEQLERKYTLINSGVTTDEIAVIAAKLVNTEPELIFKPGKERDRVRARSLFCY